MVSGHNCVAAALLAIAQPRIGCLVHTDTSYVQARGAAKMPKLRAKLPTPTDRIPCLLSSQPRVICGLLYAFLIASLPSTQHVCSGAAAGQLRAGARPPQDQQLGGRSAERRQDEGATH